MTRVLFDKKGNKMEVAFIKTSEVNSEKIKEILGKYLIESEFDEDGDVVVDDPIRIYIQVNEKEKLIRMFRFSYLFGLFDDISPESDDSDVSDEMKNKIITEINEANTISNFAKHMLFKKAILSELSLIVDNSLSEETIVRYFKKFQSELIKLSNSTPFKEWL